MATLYSDVVDAFLYRVELDRKFFNYRDLDEDEALEVAKERALTFMREACGRLMIEGMPTVDFSVDLNQFRDLDVDAIYEKGAFDFDLTSGEIYLLASLMYEQYMERDMAHLKTMNVNFTGTELRVFDPSNARKTFMTMYNAVKERNDLLLDAYKNSDRLTGQYSSIAFDNYDFDVGDYYGSDD